MNTLFTGISDKNARAFIVTNNEIQSDNKAVYITPETITGMKFNPVKYLKSEMDIVTFCMGLIKQSESEISDAIKANENMYAKLKRSRKAAAFALATAIICIKIFNKSTGDADLLKAFDLIKECKDDEHILLEYVQEAENIKGNSSVSYYWSLFMELCDNNVDTYRKIMNEICLGTECYLNQRITDILSADDGLVDNFTSKPQEKMIIMAASNQDHEILDNKNTIALLKEVILKFSGAKNKIPYRIIKLMEVIKLAEKNPDTIYGLLIEQNKGIHFGNSAKPEIKTI